MPQLDVSFMTFDPMLADTFCVTRRIDKVGDNGRTVPTDDQTFTGLYGVVTQESPSELMRNPDGQMAPRLIFVASMFAFRGPSEENELGYQPDIITWNGTQYTVKSVLPYSRYGAGTYEVIAEMMQAIGKPQ